jgi:hypothetical protein
LNALRSGSATGMEGSMNKFRLLALVVALATRTVATEIALMPSARASNETATRPWSAPIGHRQPRAADVPASSSRHQLIVDPEDANVDRKIRSVCRGC